MFQINCQRIAVPSRKGSQATAYCIRWQPLHTYIIVSTQNYQCAFWIYFITILIFWYVQNHSAYSNVSNIRTNTIGGSYSTFVPKIVVIYQLYGIRMYDITSVLFVLYMYVYNT